MIKALFKLAIGLSLFAIAIVIGPLIGIWALNTLFGHVGLNIDYTWQTWLAFLLLFGSITGLKVSFKK